MSPNDLIRTFGITGQHPDFPLEDWQRDVAAGDTRDGYWTWCARELRNAQNDWLDAMRESQLEIPWV